jgi:hypothetical protein
MVEVPPILKHSRTKLPELASIVDVHVPSVGVALMPPTVAGLDVDVGM